ncbi:MAG: SMP-30/gluconolactonase/LRE family protein [Acidobacteria bacterium]|nr:SMP-30/gluconolactonase/LRE family protein [Acidobacteriota bacterium]
MKNMKTRFGILLLAIGLFYSTSTSGQAPGAGTPGAPAMPEAPPDTMAPDIPGVVKGGTPVRLIRDLFQSVEGAISMPDGSLLFTEQDNGDGALVKVDNNGNISTFLLNTNRTIGLAYDPKGRLVGVQSRNPKVAVLLPTPMVLADSFEGVPLVFPNDLTIDKKGGIYFTDQTTDRFRPVPASRVGKPLIFYIRPDGKLVKASEEVTRPNGLILSPDEKTLIASNGPTMAGFDVQSDGTLTNFRVWATLQGMPKNAQGEVTGGADSICVDNDGRLYASTGVGVQVFSPKGEHLGTIVAPLSPQSVAFGGPDKKTLFIVGRGAAFSVQMIAQGPMNRAK